MAETKTIYTPTPRLAGGQGYSYTRDAANFLGTTGVITSFVAEGAKTAGQLRSLANSAAADQWPAGGDLPRQTTTVRSIGGGQAIVVTRYGRTDAPYVMGHFSSGSIPSWERPDGLVNLVFDGTSKVPRQRKMLVMFWTLTWRAQGTKAPFTTENVGYFNTMNSNPIELFGYTFQPGYLRLNGPDHQSRYIGTIGPWHETLWSATYLSNGWRESELRERTTDPAYRGWKTGWVDALPAKPWGSLFSPTGRYAGLA